MSEMSGFGVRYCPVLSGMSVTVRYCPVVSGTVRSCPVVSFQPQRVGEALCKGSHMGICCWCVHCLCIRQSGEPKLPIGIANPDRPQNLSPPLDEQSSKFETARPHKCAQDGMCLEKMSQAYNCAEKRQRNGRQAQTARQRDWAAERVTWAEGHMGISRSYMSLTLSRG